MTAWSSGLPQSALVVMLFLAIVPTLIHAAPLADQSTEMDSYYPVADSTGCYYNFQHYDEGDRILTNEPCLNCTCHNRMLMCYLRVCPFTKAIGQDCTVEKRADQCCPVITCPEVPVQLLPSTTPSTALGHLNEYGCFIDNLFYSDGARVPSNPNKPCELCYCIRNRTACVMQECTLNIEGCKPVYQDGVCCPVKYDCDHPGGNLLEATTTSKPATGLIFTTTMQPGSTECTYKNEVYADGALIEKEIPCQHCYCMKGDIVCAVQECSPTPLDKVNCTAIPPREGQCCTDNYDCDNIIEQELTTLSYFDYTTSSQGLVQQPVESENEEENAILPTLHPAFTGKPYDTEQTQPHTYLPPTTEAYLTRIPELEGQPTGQPEVPYKEGDHKPTTQNLGITEEIPFKEQEPEIEPGQPEIPDTTEQPPFKEGEAHITPSQPGIEYTHPFGGDISTETPEATTQQSGKPGLPSEEGEYTPGAEFPSATEHAPAIGEEPGAQPEGKPQTTSHPEYPQPGTGKPFEGEYTHRPADETPSTGIPETGIQPTGRPGLPSEESGYTPGAEIPSGTEHVPVKGEEPGTQPVGESQTTGYPDYTHPGTGKPVEGGYTHTPAGETPSTGTYVTATQPTGQHGLPSEEGGYTPGAELPSATEHVPIIGEEPGVHPEGESQTTDHPEFPHPGTGTPVEGEYTHPPAGETPSTGIPETGTNPTGRPGLPSEEVGYTPGAEFPSATEHVPTIEEEPSAQPEGEPQTTGHPEYPHPGTGKPVEGEYTHLPAGETPSTGIPETGTHPTGRPGLPSEEGGYTPGAEIPSATERVPIIGEEPGAQAGGQPQTTGHPEFPHLGTGKPSEGEYTHPPAGETASTGIPETATQPTGRPGMPSEEGAYTPGAETPSGTDQAPVKEEEPAAQPEGEPQTTGYPEFSHPATGKPFEEGHTYPSTGTQPTRQPGVPSEGGAYTPGTEFPSATEHVPTIGEEPGAQPEGQPQTTGHPGFPHAGTGKPVEGEYTHPSIGETSSTGVPEIGTQPTGRPGLPSEEGEYTHLPAGETPSTGIPDTGTQPTRRPGLPTEEGGYTPGAEIPSATEHIPTIGEEPSAQPEGESQTTGHPVFPHTGTGKPIEGEYTHLPAGETPSTGVPETGTQPTGRPGLPSEEGEYTPGAEIPSATEHVPTIGEEPGAQPEGQPQTTDRPEFPHPGTGQPVDGEYTHPPAGEPASTGVPETGTQPTGRPGVPSDEEGYTPSATEHVPMLGEEPGAQPEGEPQTTGHPEFPHPGTGKPFEGEYTHPAASATPSTGVTETGTQPTGQPGLPSEEGGYIPGAEIPSATEHVPTIGEEPGVQPEGEPETTGHPEFPHPGTGKPFEEEYTHPPAGETPSTGVPEIGTQPTGRPGLPSEEGGYTHPPAGETPSSGVPDTGTQPTRRPGLPTEEGGYTPGAEIPSATEHIPTIGEEPSAQPEGESQTTGHPVFPHPGTGKPIGGEYTHLPAGETPSTGVPETGTQPTGRPDLPSEEGGYTHPPAGEPPSTGVPDTGTQPTRQPGLPTEEGGYTPGAEIPSATEHIPTIGEEPSAQPEGESQTTGHPVFPHPGTGKPIEGEYTHLPAGETPSTGVPETGTQPTARPGLPSEEGEYTPGAEIPSATEHVPTIGEEPGAQLEGEPQITGHPEYPHPGTGKPIEGEYTHPPAGETPSTGVPETGTQPTGRPGLPSEEGGYTPGAEFPSATEHVPTIGEEPSAQPEGHPQTTGHPEYPHPGTGKPVEGEYTHPPAGETSSTGVPETGTQPTRRPGLPSEEGEYTPGAEITSATEHVPTIGEKPGEQPEGQPQTTSNPEYPQVSTSKPTEGEYTHQPADKITQPAVPSEFEPQATVQPEIIEPNIPDSGAQVTGETGIIYTSTSKPYYETEQTQPHTYLPPTTDASYSNIPQLEEQVTGKPDIPSGLTTEGAHVSIEGHVPKVEEATETSVTHLPQQPEHPYVPEEQGLTHIPEKPVTHTEGYISQTTGRPEFPYPGTGKPVEGEYTHPPAGETPYTGIPETGTHPTEQPGVPSEEGGYTPSATEHVPTIGEEPGAQPEGKPQTTGHPEYPHPGTGKPVEGEYTHPAEGETPSTGIPETGTHPTRRPGLPSEEGGYTPGAEFPSATEHVPTIGEEPSAQPEGEPQTTGHPEYPHPGTGKPVEGEYTHPAEGETPSTGIPETGTHPTRRPGLPSEEGGYTPGAEFPSATEHVPTIGGEPGAQPEGEPQTTGHPEYPHPGTGKPVEGEYTHPPAGETPSTGIPETGTHPTRRPGLPSEEGGYTPGAEFPSATEHVPTIGEEPSAQPEGEPQTTGHPEYPHPGTGKPVEGEYTHPAEGETPSTGIPETGTHPTRRPGLPSEEGGYTPGAEFPSATEHVPTIGGEPGAQPEGEPQTTGHPEYPHPGTGKPVEAEYTHPPAGETPSTGIPETGTHPTGRPGLPSEEGGYTPGAEFPSATEHVPTIGEEPSAQPEGEPQTTGHPEYPQPGTGKPVEGEYTYPPAGETSSTGIPETGTHPTGRPGLPSEEGGYTPGAEFPSATEHVPTIGEEPSAQPEGEPQTTGHPEYPHPGTGKPVEGEYTHPPAGETPSTGIPETGTHPTGRPGLPSEEGGYTPGAEFPSATEHVPTIGEEPSAQPEGEPQTTGHPEYPQPGTGKPVEGEYTYPPAGETSSTGIPETGTHPTGRPGLPSEEGGYTPGAEFPSATEHVPTIGEEPSAQPEGEPQTTGHPEYPHPGTGKPVEGEYTHPPAGETPSTGIPETGTHPTGRPGLPSEEGGYTPGAEFPSATEHVPTIGEEPSAQPEGEPQTTGHPEYPHPGTGKPVEGEYTHPPAGETPSTGIPETGTHPTGRPGLPSEEGGYTPGAEFPSATEHVPTIGEEPSAQPEGEPQTTGHPEYPHPGTGKPVEGEYTHPPAGETPSTGIPETGTHPTGRPGLPSEEGGYTPGAEFPSATEHVPTIGEEPSAQPEGEPQTTGHPEYPHPGTGKPVEGEYTHPPAGETPSTGIPETGTHPTGRPGLPSEEGGYTPGAEFPSATEHVPTIGEESSAQPEGEPQTTGHPGYPHPDTSKPVEGEYTHPPAGETPYTRIPETGTQPTGQPVVPSEEGGYTPSATEHVPTIGEEPGAQPEGEPQTTGHPEYPHPGTGKPVEGEYTHPPAGETPSTGIPETGTHHTGRPGLPSEEGEYTPGAEVPSATEHVPAIGEEPGAQPEGQPQTTDRPGFPHPGTGEPVEGEYTHPPAGETPSTGVPETGTQPTGRPGLPSEEGGYTPGAEIPSATEQVPTIGEEPGAQPEGQPQTTGYPEFPHAGTGKPAEGGYTHPPTGETPSTGVPETGTQPTGRPGLPSEEGGYTPGTEIPSATEHVPTMAEEPSVQPEGQPQTTGYPEFPHPGTGKPVEAEYPHPPAGETASTGIPETGTQPTGRPGLPSEEGGYTPAAEIPSATEHVPTIGEEPGAQPEGQPLTTGHPEFPHPSTGKPVEGEYTHPSELPEGAASTIVPQEHITEEYATPPSKGEYVPVQVVTEGEISSESPVTSEIESEHTTYYPSHIPAHVTPEGAISVTKLPPIIEPEGTTFESSTGKPFIPEGEIGVTHEVTATEVTHVKLPEGEIATTKRPEEEGHPTEGEYVPVEVLVEAERPATEHEPGVEKETEETPEHGVPGEGSCLVDGQTYGNNSNVPPINHCQISCKCISSILQCESVTCSPAPSNLQNCMPVYQGPDSCCPTYSCTVPETPEIESDSHKMEGTTITEQPVTIPISILPPEVESTERFETNKPGESLSTEIPERVPITGSKVTETTEAATVTGYPNTTPMKPFETEEHTPSKPSQEGITDYTTAYPSKPSIIDHFPEQSTHSAEHTTGSYPASQVPEGVPHETHLPEHTAQPTEHPEKEITGPTTESIQYTTNVPLKHEEQTPFAHVTEKIPPEEHVPGYTEEVAQPTEYPQLMTEIPEKDTTEGVVHIPGVTSPSEGTTEYEAPEKQTSPEEGPYKEHTPGYTEAPEGAPSKPGVVPGQVPPESATETVTSTGSVEITTDHRVPEGHTPSAHITEKVPSEGYTPQHPEGVEGTPAVTEGVPGEVPKGPATEGVEYSTGIPSKPYEFTTEHIIPEDHTPSGGVTEKVPTGISEGVPTQPITEGVEYVTRPSGFTKPAEHVPGYTEKPEKVPEKPEGPTEEAPAGVVTEGGEYTTEGKVPAGQTPSSLVTEKTPFEEHITEYTKQPVEITGKPSATGEASEVPITEGIEYATGTSLKPSGYPTEHIPSVQVTEKLPGYTEEIALPTEYPSVITESPEDHVTDGIIHITGTSSKPLPEGQTPSVQVTEGITHIPGYTEGAEEAHTKPIVPSGAVTEGTEYTTGTPSHPSDLITESKRPEEHIPDRPTTETDVYATGTPSKPVEFTTEHISKEPIPSEHLTEKVPSLEHVPGYTEGTEVITEGLVTEGFEYATGTTSKHFEFTTEHLPSVTEKVPHEDHVPGYTEGQKEVSGKPSVTGEIPAQPSTESIEYATATVPSKFSTEHVPGYTEGTEKLPGAPSGTEEMPTGPSVEGVEHTTGIPSKPEFSTDSHYTEGPKEVPSITGESTKRPVTEGAEYATGTSVVPSEFSTEHVHGYTEEPEKTSQPSVLGEVPTGPIGTPSESPEEQTPAVSVTEKLPHEEHRPEGTPSGGEYPTGTSTKPHEFITEHPILGEQTPSVQEEVSEPTKYPQLTTELPEEEVVHIGGTPSKPGVQVTEEIPFEGYTPSYTEHVPEATGQPEFSTERVPEGVEHVPGFGAPTTEAVEYETRYPSEPTEGEKEGVPHGEQTTEVTGYPNTTPVKSFEFEDHTTSKPFEHEPQGTETVPLEGHVPGEHVTVGIEYATGLPGGETEYEPGVIEHITGIPSKPEGGVTTSPEEHPTEGPEHETGLPIETSEQPLPGQETLKPELAGTVAPGAEATKPTHGFGEVTEISVPSKEVSHVTTGLEPHGEITTLSSAIPSVEGELSTGYPDLSTGHVINETSAHYPHVTEPFGESSTSTPEYAGHTPEIPDYHLPQEEEYEEEEQSAFGPGTCRYGGKVYVSAQQIPRDDPCDFCFCFRSDIICLQQSCPPPIPRCHEEPIRGFCCPRYECPVSMATTLNITTTTTTTTTTLPPHFFSHAYKGRATRQGCQIQGKAYQVGEEVPSASGPCLQCKCGGNGQMKCDPKACSPEPMLRKMIAEVASRRRR